MKPLHGKYLLKGVLDHKEKYQLTPDIELKIDKSFDNNLRRRNSQLGIVSEVPIDNVLGLKKGDTVVTHHFTFFGDIADNRGFSFQQHIEHENELYFTVEADRIFFRYNEQTPEPIGKYVLCDKIEKEPNKYGIIIHDVFKDETNRAEVSFGNGEIEKGDILILPDNAMYEIELDKKYYQRIFMHDIYAVIRDKCLMPYGDYFIAEDIKEDKKSNGIDLSLVKSRGVKSVVIATGSKCDYVSVGDIVYRGPNTGLKVEDKVLLNYDHIHFKIL